mmetsp:Transcript_609/g.955  ORF Transcript_609/g.955 Transcript_609/m.955 type:complete len:271 (+) Transcript_609:94-906(+)
MTARVNDAYVVLDERGNEIEDENSAGLTISAEDDLKSLSYLVEIFAIFIIGGGVCSVLFHFDKILALQILLGLLLVQILYGLKMRRPCGLPIMKYLSGKGINAALDEVIEQRECGKLRPTYVISYDTKDENGQKVTIRKTLKPNVFTGVTGNSAITEQVARDIGFVTRVQIAEGYPKSAHPRRSLLSRYEALRVWNMYFLPALVLTIMGTAFALYSITTSQNVDKAEYYNVLTVYAIIYPILLVSFGTYHYLWSKEVLYGGEIIGSTSIA